MTVEANKNNDEAAIQRLLDDGIRSLRDKNIAGVMSLYAQEVVSFDIVPPLRYVGAEAFRKVWEEVFSVYQGPIDYEVHDLNITVGDDVAFTHSLNRISGTLTNGQKTDLWLRWRWKFWEEAVDFLSILLVVLDSRSRGMRPRISVARRCLLCYAVRGTGLL